MSIKLFPRDENFENTCFSRISLMVSTLWQMMSENSKSSCVVTLLPMLSLRYCLMQETWELSFLSERRFSTSIVKSDSILQILRGPTQFTEIFCAFRPSWRLQRKLLSSGCMGAHVSSGYNTRQRRLELQIETA